MRYQTEIWYAYHDTPTPSLKKLMTHSDAGQ